MPQVCLVIEYDGSQFCGWQKQPGERSIQAELERALGLVLRAPISPLTSSGRTDSGVHAKRQVVTFRCEQDPDLRRIVRGVSGILRNEVSVLEAGIVPDTFHARFSAVRKQYCYTILHREAPPSLDKGRVWHLRCPLNIEALRADAQLLVGTHDFSSFRGGGCAAKSPIRTIFASDFEYRAPYLLYRVEGNGFLKQMVRNIVGTIIDCARGRLPLSLAEVLAARDRTKAGVAAPAAGLMMEWVEYDPPLRQQWLRHLELLCAAGRAPQETSS